MTDDPVRYAVYAYRDKRRRVLYVGHTTNLARRNGEHARTAPWWPKAVYLDAMLDITTLERALAIEAAFIRAYNPIHNSKENRGTRTGYPDGLTRRYQ